MRDTTPLLRVRSPVRDRLAPGARPRRRGAAGAVRLLAALAVAGLVGGAGLATSGLGATAAACPRPSSQTSKVAAVMATTGPAVAAASAHPGVAVPAIAYSKPAVAVSPPGVRVNAVVATHGSAGWAFVRFGESGYLRCSDKVSLAPGKHLVDVSVELNGLTPRATYLFEVGASTAAGTAYGHRETFTAPLRAIAPGVSVGPISLGGDTGASALKVLEHFLAGRLRFTLENAYWSVPRATLGAEIHPSATIERALAAKPDSHLRLQLTFDEQRLQAYLNGINTRFGHAASGAYIRLVGTRAVVAPGRPSVEVDLPRMASAVQTALASGLPELLRVIVSPTAGSDAPPSRAVVVRLASQTLTAYLNGKPLLQTPVTTGRPALPTPVGSYRVIFRASPFVFNSPWPPGSPFWYPPTPVTWAMDFYGGDFLHDDPGEPSNAFGAGSEYGPYASHGCIHVPHAVMAFLYNWLPIGGQVIVSDT